MKKIYVLIFVLIASLGMKSVFAAGNEGKASAFAPYTAIVTNSLGCGATLTSDVAVAGICAGGTIKLTATGAGGSGTNPYGFAFSETHLPAPSPNGNLPGGNPFTGQPAALATQTITAVSPTVTTTYTYKVVVTSATGVTCSANTTIVINPLPTANAGRDTTICGTGTSLVLGGTATIPTGTGGTPGYTYNWAGTPTPSPVSNATPSITVPAGGGTYITTVTDSKGCTASKAIIVSQKTITTAPTKDANNICPGATVNFDAVPGGGTVYTYKWSGGTITPTTGSKTPSDNPSATTAYNVTVTDASTCSATGTVTVTVKTLTSAPTATPPGPVCPNTSITLNAVPGGGTTYTYVWTAADANGATTAPSSNTVINPTASPSITTTYTVVVSEGGCSVTGTVVVNVNVPPAPVLSFVNNPICLGTTASITITGATGTPSWGTPTPAAGAGTASSSPTPTLAGSYTYPVTVTDAAGCTGSATSPSLVVNSLPTPNVTPSSKTICVGSSYDLGETNVIDPTAVAYIWSHPETSINNPAGNDATPHPTVKPALGVFTYIVTVTDANGCSATDDVTVTVTSGPTVTLPDGSTCAGVPYTLVPTVSGGTAPYVSYAWTPAAPGSNNMNFDNIPNPILQTPAATQLYAVVVTDNVGCTGSIDATITVNPAPVATVTDNFPAGYCSGIPIDVDNTADIPGSTFTWTAPIYTGTVTGGGAGAGPHIGQTLTGSGTAKYTVTPTGPAPSSCVGNPVDVTVIINPIPPAPIVRDTAYCETATAKPFSFMITSGATNPSWYNNAAATPPSIAEPPVNTAAGAPTPQIIYVTETLLGCEGPTAKITVTINSSDNPNFSYSSGTYCKVGGSIQSPTPTTPGGTYSFLVSSGGGATNLDMFSSTNGSFNVANSDVGTYRIKYTTGGTCFDTMSVLVTITNSFVADFHYNGPFCLKTANPSPIFDNSGTAGTFTEPTGNLKFVSSSTGQINLTTSIAGTYTVTNTIAASGSCPAVVFSNTVVINGLPVVNTGTVKGICNGGNVQIGLPQVGTDTYSWTPTASIVMPSTGTDPNPTVAPTTKTKYTLIETDGTTGCVNSDTVTVSVAPIPATPTVANVSVCKGNTATLTVTAPIAAGMTYQWYDPAIIPGATATAYTTPVQNTVGPVTYSVEAISSFGCISLKKTATVTVVAHDDSSFTYANSTYCRSGTNPCPTITGQAGGKFSFVYVSGGAGPAYNLAISTSTGCINLAISNTGTYDVFYNTTAAGKQCPTTGKFRITITDAPDASFSYAGPYCQFGSPNPLPIFTTGSAGTFTSTAGFKFVSNANSSTTGQVDLGFTLPNTYTVTNTIPASAITGCSMVTATATITINAKPNAPVTKPVSYCLNSTTSPLTPCGGTIKWYDASTNGTLYAGCPTPVNAPAASTTYYADTTVNGCTSNRSPLVVTINPLPVAPTVTTPVTYCKNDVSVPLAATGTGANVVTFYGPSPSTATFVGNPSTGSVGTFIYTADQKDANGCVGPKASITVNVNPYDVATFTYSSSTYCTTGSNPAAIPGAGQTAGGTYSILPDKSPSLMLNPSTGLLDVGNMDVGTSYVVKYNTASAPGNCHSTATFTVTIISAPTANFDYGVGAFCEYYTPNPILPNITGTSSGVFSTLSAPFLSTSELNSATGGVSLPVTSGTYVVTNTVAPANGCAGTSYNATIVINPTPVADAGVIATICAGSTATIGAAQVTGSTYQWSPATGIVPPSTSTDPSITVSPSATTPYTVVETTTPGCTASNQVIITVIPTPASPTVTGNPSTTICSGNNTILTASTGNPSDVFNWYDTGGVILPGGSATSTYDTGILTVTTTYYVDATTTINGTSCSGPRIPVVVTVVPQDNPSFNYPAASYCKTYATNPMVQNKMHPTGTFTFTSIPAGLSLALNSVTGEIDLINSQAGSYIVTYTTSGSICPQPHSEPITITDPPTADFFYNPSTVCQSPTSSLVPIQLIGTATAGTFSSIPPGVNTSNGDMDKSLPAGPGGTIYKITNLIASNGAVGSCATVFFNANFTINPIPVASFPPPPRKCSPNIATLNADVSTNSPGCIYTWSFGDGTANGSGASVTHPFNYSKNFPYDTFLITLNVTNPASAGSCPATPSSVSIIADQLPDPDIQLYNDIVTNLRPTANLTGQHNAGDQTNYDTYTWTYGDGTPDETFTGINSTEHEYAKPGDYIVILNVKTTPGGCYGADTIPLNVKEQTEVWIPDAFTPNGDGNNDTFGPRGISIKGMQMFIYDRWGNLMYSSDDFGKPWTGNASGSSELAQQDVYVYKIIITDYRGKILDPFVGRVTLIR